MLRETLRTSITSPFFDMVKRCASQGSSILAGIEISWDSSWAHLDTRTE